MLDFDSCLKIVEFGVNNYYIVLFVVGELNLVGYCERINGVEILIRENCVEV